MESGPVFADPSGRRHRVLRCAGLVTAALLTVCLGAVAVAMTGGPQAPFTQWAAPRVPAAGAPGHTAARSNRNASGRGGTNGAVPGTGPSASAVPAPPSGASPSARPSAAASASRARTNPVGKTLPGHTKSPSPHKPASVA